jgi:hypothetical protein
MAWHNIKVTHQEFEMQLATVEARMRFKEKAGIRIVVVEVTKVWCIHILDSAENCTSVHHSAEASCQYHTCIPRCSNTLYHHTTERLLWRSPADDLKARTQLSGKPLHEFSAVIEKLAHLEWGSLGVCWWCEGLGNGDEGLGSHGNCHQPSQVCM